MSAASVVQVRGLSDRYLAGQSFGEFWAGVTDFVGDELDHVGLTPSQQSAFDALYERVYMARLGLTAAAGRTPEEELREFLRTFPWESIGIHS